MTLDDIIRKVVYNKDVHDLLKQLDLTQPYGKIVQFQIDACIAKGTSIYNEGFQIGEPFDGDIENAPILFLSSNPAFNFDEVSPRYFTASGNVFKPEHVSITKQVKFSDFSYKGGYSFNDIRKMFTEPEKAMSLDDIKKFLKIRIQNSPARNDADQTLRIPLKDGGTVEVPYWTCVKNNTELLLPIALKNKWACLKHLKPRHIARRIMKYAVCMEIVPFRSNREKGVAEAKDTCFNNFTKYLLELSAASVIVLVGNEVFEVFTRQLKISGADKNTLEKHGVVKVTIGNKQRLVVKVDFIKGKFSRFGKFFDPNVIADLQNAVASSSFVQKAIQSPVGN